MKNVKRVIALLLIMLLCVSGVTDVAPIYAYAQNWETMQRADGNLQTLSQDMSIEGSNSIGNMIASELTSKQEEQRENNGCNIFSAEVDKKCVSVSLETVKDGTLVAAIYEEDGIKMLASGTKTVKAGEEKAEVTIDTDSMPSYFYLRVFLVDSDTLQPLASSYESPNYTKEMQEFLSKTTEDFDKDRVYNMDEDKATNFIVYKENTKVIYQSGETNRLVSAEEGKNQYTFENADETITSLSTGDIFVYDRGENNLLVVKVADIQKDGTTVTITGEDASMEEAFAYVKIEGDADTSEVTVDNSTCEEGVVYNGLVEEKEDTAEKQTQPVPPENGEVTAEAGQVDAIDLVGSVSKGLSYTFLDKKLVGGDTNNIKLSGGIEYKNRTSLKLYLTMDYQYMELKIENAIKVNIAVEGRAKGSISLGTLGFMPVAGVIIEITPKFVVEANAKIEAQGTLKGTAGFSVSSDEGMKNLSSFPNFKSSGIQTEGTIFIGLSLDPRVAIICDEIVKVGFKSKIGAEIKGTMTHWKPKSDSEIHSCNQCIDGDISGKFTVEFETKFLNQDKLKFKLLIAEVTVKVADFYYSFDQQKGGWSTCPYQKYKVDITVKDEEGKSIGSVRIKAPFSVKDVDGQVRDADFLITDSEGNVKGYLASGEIMLQVSKDGYEEVEKKTVVKDGNKKIAIKLTKKPEGIQEPEKTKKPEASEEPKNPTEGNEGTKQKYSSVPRKILSNVGSVTSKEHYHTSNSNHKESYIQSNCYCGQCICRQQETEKSHRWQEYNNYWQKGISRL